MTTLRDLVLDCRTELDDLPGDVDNPCSWENDDTGLLWKNFELTKFANQAQVEFCRRRPITDSDTTAICTASVTAGDLYVPYSPLVAYVDRMSVQGEAYGLFKRTKAWMDRNFANWETETGIPKYYIENFTEYKARLYPIPDTNITVNMTVGRLPLTDMRWDHRQKDEPEINVMYHPDLIPWMCHLALNKRDSETFNKTESDRHYQLFETAVGPRISAFNERMRGANRGHPIRTRAQPR